MKQKYWILLAAGGSVSLLLSAIIFQYWENLVPCKLCIWQRYPHVVAIAMSLVALRRPNSTFIILGSLTVLISAGIGLYHVGVESRWWQGPVSCTSSSIEGMTTEDLFNQIMKSPVVRCDDIAWQFAGISMAGWNVLLSIILAGFWLLALRKR